VDSLQPSGGSVVSPYTDAIRALLRSELGEELVGIYLYGSAADGSFIAGHSDVDLIVVTRGRLPVEQVRRLLEALRGVPSPGTIRGLDLWVVPLESARKPCATPRFECWLLTSVDVELAPEGADEGDARLVLLYAMCRDHGVALIGPAPRRVFGPIKRDWLVEAMLVDLALAGAAGWYRVLNACRTLHFIERGTMCGKTEGAAWAHPRVQDSELIDDALEWRRHRLGPPLALDRVDAFVDAVALRLGGPPPSLERIELSVAALPADGDPFVTCALLAPPDEQLLSLAVERFLEQRWPARELVVLKPPGAAPGLRMPNDNRIAVVPLRADQMGLWQEVAQRHASGDVIATWDPATWYTPERLTQQVRELLSTSVPRVIAPSVLVLDAAAGTSRRAREPELLERTTLCALRSAWTDGGLATRRGERDGIAVLVERGAVPHDDPEAREDALRLLGDARELYAASAPAAAWPPARQPFVSCLMPTYNRPTFAARAIDFFLNQDYPNRELVIVDDGEESISHLVPAHADVAIRYHRLETRASIGNKRELACELADGNVLVQWDDDDWHGAARLRRQVAPLATGAADMTGILRGYLLDLRTLRFWKGAPPLHEGSLHPLIVAGTLAFTREAWLEAGGYPDRSIGEEVALLAAIKSSGGAVATVLCDGIFVQVRHASNSWRLPFAANDGPPGWFEVPRPQFMPLADLRFYQAIHEAATAA
jgi:hypothetical protein